MAGLLIYLNPALLIFINLGSYRVARQDHLNIKKPSKNGPGVNHGI